MVKHYVSPPDGGVVIILTVDNTRYARAKQFYSGCPSPTAL